METLRSGDFNTQLYERIENCRDVVVIVSKEALQFREKREQDWVRLEVAHAIKHKKNIIPVFLRDVTIPQKEDLPEDIAELVMKNGVTASEEHFDSALKKICRLLYSRRQVRHKLLFAAAALLLIALAGTGYYFYKNPVYPLTHAEKQEFSLIYSYLVQQLENTNLTENCYVRLLESAKNAVLTGEMDDFRDEQACFENHLKNMKNVPFQNEFVRMAQRSKVIDAGDLRLFPQIYENYIAFVGSKSDMLAGVIAPQNLTSRSDKLRIIEINREFGSLLSESVELSFIALLNKVRSSSIDDFKKLIAPQLTNMKRLSVPWPEKQSDIVSLLNSGNEQMKVLLQEEATIVGKLSQAKNTEEHRLRQLWKKQGLSEVEINKLLEKMYDISRKK